MKRINLLKIALPVAVMAVAGCDCGKNKYTISGTLADEAFDGATVYMTDIENLSEKMDSAVVANGTFAFEGVLKKPVVATLTVKGTDGKRAAAQCVVEAGTITVDMDNGKVAGTPQNEDLAELQQVGRDEMDYMEALYKEYLAAETSELRKELEAVYDSVLKVYRAKHLAALEKVYNENTDNILGAYALYSIINDKRDAGTINSTQVDSILATAAPVVKNFSLIAKELEGMRNLERTSVGKTYTDLDLLEGEAMTATKLSQHIDGKVALIDFWASWCGPCRAEIPNIAEMHKKYADKGVVVIGLNVWDKPDAQRKTIESMNMTWLQLADTTTTSTDIYGVYGIPQIILIGADGTILARDLRGEAIETAIVEALK